MRLQVARCRGLWGPPEGSIVGSFSTISWLGRRNKQRKGLGFWFGVLGEPVADLEGMVEGLFKV